LAGAIKLGPRLPERPDGQPSLILVNLSGRGDKDVDTAIKWFDLDTGGRGSESAKPTAEGRFGVNGLQVGGPSTGAGEQR
jgi:tryptophan synthase beta chain